eukprot:140933-Amphidinium_carterae.1
MGAVWESLAFNLYACALKEISINQLGARVTPDPFFWQHPKEVQKECLLSKQRERGWCLTS